jgi:Tol biopolymer transport system component
VPAKLFLVIAAAGCGRIGFDATMDAPLGSGPFGPAVLLDINRPAAADDDPALTGDALEMMFDSDRSGTSELYVTKREERTAAWSTPVIVPETSSPSDEDGPMFSADGLMLTFSSTRPGGLGMDDLWYTTRASRTSAWAAPQLVTELCSAAVDEHMTLTADKLYTVFVSTRAGPRDLYMSQRSSISAPWEPPQPLTELNDGSYMNAPALDPTGTILFFASNRGSSAAIDLFVATRTSRGEPFGAPVPVVELNSAQDDADPTISADLHVLAFVRGDTAGRDIYLTER